MASELPANLWRAGWGSPLGCLLALLLCSCAGYKLGPTGGFRAGEKSIQINPVANATVEPRLGSAVSHALRKTFQRDGTFRLDTRGTGDIVVNTKITHYYRVAVAYRHTDTLTAYDYDVNILAKVVATDRHTGRQILDKEVRGHTLIRVGTDMVSSERQALPLLADNLAQTICSLLADGEW
jgi:hypothetical protein